MLMRLQNTILERIAKGEPLAETMDYLCRTVEGMVPDIVSSVLSLDDEGRLRHLAGPSIPEHYAAAIDGVQCGEGVGSCGTAAFRGEAVMVTDIETDPFWADFKVLALPLGFRACWSTPIISNGKVLGTFAFYFPRPRGPSEIEEAIVSASVHLCAIGMERELRITENRRLAYTDALTRLPNRASFNEAMSERAIDLSPWGLLLLDLDNLKLVNDTFGHQAGDDLIRAVGDRLRAITDGNKAFRLGGDEFAVIVEGGDCVDLSYHAAHILDALKVPCICAGQTVYPAGTIGGAIARNGQLANDVRQNADFALYEAKERCRGQFVEYTTGTGSRIVRRFKALQNVGEALREGRIDAFYQPIVRLETGDIIGFEALCRMRSRTGEIIAAADFHEATVDVKLARDLTSRMLDVIAADASRWEKLGLDFGHICINVSSADFAGAGLTDRISSVMQAAAVPLDRLVVEVTESVYLSQREQSVLEQLKLLRQAGIAVALDDFGTGFASLTHLLSIPFDIIKVDRSFTERLMTEPRASIIIEGLITMSQRLGFSVVSEGIETKAQQQKLLSMGCQEGQGYLFAHPLDRTAVEALLVRDAAAEDIAAPSRAYAIA